MKLMRVVALLATGSFTLAVGAAAAEGLLAYEPFDYRANEYLSPGNGGEGFAGSWSASLPGAVGSEFIIGTSSLAYLGLADHGAQTHTPGTFSQADKRTLAPTLGEDGTVRYFSLVVRPDGRLDSGEFGLRLRGGAGQDLLAGKPRGGSTLNYVLENIGGAGQVATPKAVVQGEISLLVLKLEFRPGPDRISLFVNPPLLVEPILANAVKEDLDLGLIAGVALYGNTAWSADELRLGTTYASVTPPAPDFDLRQPLSEDIFEHRQVSRLIQTVQPLAPGRTLTFQLVGESFGATINPATGEFNWIPGELEDGQTRVFTVRATSNANPPASVQKSFFLYVQEGNLPPQLDAIADQEVIEGSTLTYQLLATDPDIPAQPLFFQVIEGPTGLSVSPSGLLTWIPTTAHAERSFPVKVLVGDNNVGRAERSFTVTVHGRKAFFAKWIGTVDGDWNNPANWDIGRVPNNNPTNTFDVTWDAHPVTIHVTGSIAVSSFNWSGGGTLDLQSAAGNLTVEEMLFWSDGTLGGQGGMTVHGRATLLAQGSQRLTLQDECQLVFQDYCELQSPLFFAGDGGVVVEQTATLGVPAGGGFERIRGAPELRNEGTIDIWSSAQPVPLIFLRNRGTVTVFANILEFRTGAATDLIQEGSGILSLGSGAEIADRAIINGKVMINEGSSLIGDGHIREAQIDGRIQGRLSFDKLSLGPTATSAFDVVGLSRNHLFARQPLNLAGRLEIDPLRGVTPGPDEVFELVFADGEITGQFSGADFGQRIQLPFGTGSFLLTRSTDSLAVRLSGFLPPAIGLESAPLTFRLPEVSGQLGGCFVVPHPAINLPPGNWAGGRLEVEVIGFDPASDLVNFQRNPAFPGVDDIIFEGPSEGMTAKYRNAPVGTARIVGAKMTCLLDASAHNDAIVALLGRLYYANSELTPDWFTEPQKHYSQRGINITLIDATGIESHIEREVSLPYLFGIRLPESLLLPRGSSAVLQLQGVFSNGQALPVRKLQTVWGQSCGSGITTNGVLAGPVADFPGQQNVRGNETRGLVADPEHPEGDLKEGFLPYCCTVYATAGFLQAGIRIYEGRIEKNTLSPLLNIFLITFLFGATGEDCPMLKGILESYIVPPDCASTPRPGATLHSYALGPSSFPSATAFYALEALMKTTAAGRRWVDIYRQHGAEVIRVFLSHPPVMMKSKELVAAFFPGITALLAGKGDEVIITPAMITLVNSFWNELALHSSPALKAELDRERTRFNNFQRFQGASFAYWAGLLGIPVPTEPYIHISLVRRDADRLFLAANDIPGADLSLWRSLDLKTWDRVLNAMIKRDGITLFLTDPTPPASEGFYVIAVE